MASKSPWAIPWPSAHLLQSRRNGDDFLDGTPQPLDVVVPVQDLRAGTDGRGMRKAVAAALCRTSPVSDSDLSPEKFCDEDAPFTEGELRQRASMTLPGSQLTGGQAGTGLCTRTKPASVRDSKEGPACVSKSAQRGNSPCPPSHVHHEDARKNAGLSQTFCSAWFPLKPPSRKKSALTVRISKS